MQKNKKPELLVPAGDYDCALAAIHAGADAVYLGGKLFSARAGAHNFSDNEITELIGYAACRGVKIYVAINTLYKDSELDEVLMFAKKMYQAGAAAFILQDVGLSQLLKTSFPDIELHASTQMTCHSVAGAKYLKKLGFSRIILSRELSIAEVEEITDSSGIETEVFVHGALCVSYSGQCLMSSLVGGRSGNRGKCAQPCRLAYHLNKNGKSIKHGYLLSPKDMMTLSMLEEIVHSGVSALKIEGRMKNADYVYIVTKAYREKLDHLSMPMRKQITNKVTQIFNRGGSFSSGFYHEYAGADMMSVRTPKSSGLFCGKVIGYADGKTKIRFAEDMVPGDGIEIWTNNQQHVGCGINRLIKKNDTMTLSLDGNIDIGNDVYKSYDKKLFDDTKRDLQEAHRRLTVDANVLVMAGDNVSFTLSVPGTNIMTTAYSKSPVQEAKNAPMSKADIVAQLSKTGNSPFVLDFKQIDVDPGVFVSKTELNGVRREAILNLEDMLIHATRRTEEQSLPTLSHSSKNVPDQQLTVQIPDADMLSSVLKFDVARVYVDYNENNVGSVVGYKEHASRIFLALPVITRNDAEHAFMKRLPELEMYDFGGYLVRTAGQLEMLMHFGTKKALVLDDHFNIFNSQTKKALPDSVVTTFSQELTANQLRIMDGDASEIIIYGRQTLMTTSSCPIGLYDAKKDGMHCSKRGTKDVYALIDRKEFAFPIVTDCEHCTAFILNSKTLDVTQRFHEIKNTGVAYLRLIFTDEEEHLVNRTIGRYVKLMKGDAVEVPSNFQFTNGHFFRGAE